MLTLTTRPGCAQWCARFSGPERGRIVALFGTDTIETPWDWRTLPVAIAIARIAALNPDHEVTHEYAP